MKHSALVCVLMTGATWTAPALAQVAASSSPAPAGQSPVNTSPETANPSGQTGENDIVVTAQRRSERLGNVPISITALTAQGLASADIQSTRDLTLVTPGLRIEQTGIYVQPAIRGISTSLVSPAADANVATYLDGVYQQNTIGSIYDLPDVRQIDVLKGPQGTLFGRNATGGAILISTLDPDLTKVTGQGMVDYARFNSATGGAFISVPLIDDRLAVSATGYIGHQGAYQRDLLDGGKQRGAINDYLARVKVRFAPWQGANFILAGLYSHRHDGIDLSYSNLNGNNDANSNPALAPVIIASAPYTYALNDDSYLDATTKAVSFTGTIDIGPGSLKTITAYTDAPTDTITDGDNSPRPTSYYKIPTFSRTTSQELVYSTNRIGIFEGTIGGFYYHNDAGFNPLNINNFTQAIYTRDRDTSLAVFGEITANLTSRLKITGGLRYSNERRTADAGLALNSSVKPSLNLLGHATFDKATPRVSVLYRVTNDVNAYFTYSKGFKSGAFNSSGFQTTPVQPENVTAYEGGLKTNLLPGLSLNAAGFYYNYTDLQVSSITTVGAAFVQQLQNAATARIYGAELEGSYRASRDFTLSAGLNWLHANYLSFPSASVNIPNPDGLGGNVTVARDVSGNNLIRAPKFSANLSGTYGINTKAGRLALSGAFFYSSRVYYDVLNSISQPAYVTINARLGLTPRPGLEIAVFGKNLTNGTVLSTLTQTAGYDAVTYLPPRTVGVEARFAF